MLIEITYNVTDVFMSTTETPVYVEISFEQPSGSAAVWGSITGTLSNQTDLQNALNAKLDESTIDGGAEGQILSKASATDFDFAWINNYAKYLATNVRNQTGSTIGAFQVVYISGATGNKPLISLADADTEATSSKTYGVTATSIANNGTGDVVTAGELSGINTSAFNEGDLLWLSTTAGGVVTTPPAEPAHAVFIGYVVRSHPTLGTIDVSIQNGYELNELHGVQITTPTDNQGLFYNATSTLWENKSITTALGYTPVPTTRNITINGVTYDLSADRTWTISAGISGSGASGQVTYWTGASAVSGSNNLFWDNTNSRLGIGTNVPISTLDVNGSIRAVGSITTSNLILTSAYTITGYFASIQLSNNTAFRTESNFTWSSPFNSPVTKMQLFSTGNLVLQNGGTFSDGGQRLQVIGDTLLRGSGNTSATTALTVQDSASSDMLRVRSDSRILIGGASTTAAPSIYAYSGITGNRSLRVGIQSAGSLTPIPAFNINQENDYTYTTGTGEFTTITANFLPTSGTGTLAYLSLKGTINQSGGANGITRGLYVNPTLTAAADFRAIETSAGNVLFGASGTGFFWDNANSRLGIGTNAPTNSINIVNGRLDISGTSSVSGSGISIGYLTGTYAWIQSWVSRPIALNPNGNNVTIGVSGGADNGQRLQVYGDTLLRGSGATSATTALTVQNSSSTNLFIVDNAGTLKIGTRPVDIFATSDGSTANAFGRGLIISTNVVSQAGVGALKVVGTYSAASGADYGLWNSHQFSPTSGTATHSTLWVNPIINQTGGANGVTRGLYVNPTLTSAADFRAIETTNGKIVFGNLPTSSAGLPTGALWNDAGTVKIV